MKQCKYKHSFVFMQFRNLFPDADVEEIEEIFKARQTHLLRQLEKVKIAINRGGLTEKTTKKVAEEEAGGPPAEGQAATRGRATF